MRKNREKRTHVQYSEAFKRQVVREAEETGLSFNSLRLKYGIGGGSSIGQWARKYGNGTIGRIIRLETPEEINEKKQLKERVRQLETLLADANIESALDKAYAKMALEQAGIKDVEGFKKKVDAGLFKKR